METSNSKEQLFGLKASGTIKKRSSAIKNFFRLQSWKFWLITYLFAFIIFYFSTITYNYEFIIHVANVFFFPFSVLLFGKVANFLKASSPMAYVLLYPSHKKHLNSVRRIYNLIFFLIKVVIFIVVWHYSFIIGIIGLILTISDVKNLTK